MSVKNKFVVLGVACASLAMVVFAQDDLDNLLQELGDKKPTAETKPAAPAAEAPAPAPAATPAEPELDLPDADLLKDIIATEKLRREALERQASTEVEDARAAMAARDWDAAYKLYRLAYAHLEDSVDGGELRKESVMGMAEAQY